MRADADLIGPEAKRECRAVVISQQAMYEHQRHRTMSGIKEGMGWCLSGFKKRADTTHDGCDLPSIRWPAIWSAREGHLVIAQKFDCDEMDRS